MWIPDKSKSLTKIDAALIERDYEDLLFYDYPILFTGINRLNDRVLGSFVESNGEIESYIHSIISARTYSSFINRKINYPQLLQEAQILFLLHWTGEESPTVYWLNYADIPESYRPNQLALCPEITPVPSFEYEVKFEGGLANNHQAIPETISKFQNKFASLLRNPFGLSALSDLILNVFLQADKADEAYQKSSLKIKYHIELNEKTPTFFYDANVYSLFLNKYISYCLQHLTDDVPKIIDENQEGLDNFNELLNEYESLIGQSKDTPEKRKTAFADNMLQVAKKLGDLTLIAREDFEQVVLSSLSESNAFPLGVLDKEFGEEIEEAILEVESKTGKTTLKDDDFNTYKIHIYDLNTDTRKGRALMNHPTESNKLMKPTFKISGTESLTQTKYTESLHFDTIIEVIARATKTDGIVKELEIEFEDS